jgi:eukaryotic translation initiation factor 2C
VVPKLITVPGRVLNAPAIKYSGTSQTIPRFGTWNMQNVQFVMKSNLSSWTYLSIFLGGRTPWRSDEDFLAKLDEFQEKLRELGISVKQYMPGVHIKPNVQQIESEVDHWIHRFAINSKRPKLLFVVVPDGATTVYNRIKYLCDVKEGILNVCVQESKFFKANVGIDVTHPSPRSSSSAPSVAAVVASVDEWLGQWPAEIRIQPARQEMVAGLDEMFKSRLLLWQKHNKALPENVLVYRDGVSEGQYNIVLDKELPMLQAACKAV